MICGSCGGNMIFDAESGMLICPICMNSFDNITGGINENDEY